MKIKKMMLLLSFVVAGSLVQAAFEDEVIARRLRTEHETVTLTRRIGNLSHPWAVAFLGEDRYLITERAGRLLLFEADGSRHEVTGLPDDIVNVNQGGLLDVVLHPNFAENGWIYMTYSRGDRHATATTLIRARLDGTALVDLEQLFTQDRMSSPGRHYGSRILFLPDHTLLMTIGDRGTHPERAQDHLDHAGTVIRLNDDGTVPEDNPFVGNDNFLPEIFSVGHRNIQGIALHPVTGEVWATDHGARGGDRLDRIDAGRNYGWPIVTPSREYRDQRPTSDRRVDFGFIPPVHEILPTLGPSGLAFAPADSFPNWEGNLLAGGLIGRHIQRMLIDEGPIRKFQSGQHRITIEGPYLSHAEFLLMQAIGRIRDVRTHPNGSVYILTDEPNGGLFRMQSAR